MEQRITGLHHITAICSDAQANVDFYAGILGLRLVKRTVNFDAPDVHHLYYGDDEGNPGTIITFFPFPGARRGRKGNGQVTATAFSIDSGSIGFWLDRLKQFNVQHQPVQERLGGEAFIYFEDDDGLGLELVATDDDPRSELASGPVPVQHAIKGFHSATLNVEGYEHTAGLLTERMDHRLIAERGNRFRFAAANRPGSFVDLVCAPDGMNGLGGSGTVHHIAFATHDDQSQQAVRERILAHGLNATPMLDRQYFHSIYFREPGGVLFEVATSDIGFTLDEQKEDLGSALKLPPWLEADRERIAAGLPPIDVELQRFADRKP